MKFNKVQKTIMRLLLYLDDERLKNIENPEYINEYLGAYVESDFTCVSVFYNVLIDKNILIGKSLSDLIIELSDKGVIFYYPLWVIKVKDREALIKMAE